MLFRLLVGGTKIFFDTLFQRRIIRVKEFEYDKTAHNLAFKLFHAVENVKFF